MMLSVGTGVAYYGGVRLLSMSRESALSQDASVAFEKPKPISL
jgi:hypothetical protein